MGHLAQQDYSMARADVVGRGSKHKESPTLCLISSNFLKSMKKAIAIILLFGLVHSANAGTSEFICQSTQGVGIKDGQLIQMYPLKLLLTRVPSNGNLSVDVVNHDGQKYFVAYKENEAENENQSFIHATTIEGGSYFSLNLRNLRFTYSSSLGYLLANQNIPDIYVGFCKQTRR